MFRSVVEGALMSGLVATVLRTESEYQLDGATHVRKLFSRPDDPPIQAIVDLGIVPRLVQLASEEDTTTAVHFEALWGLTNITSGTTEQTQVVLDAGALPVIARILEGAPNGGVAVPGTPFPGEGPPRAPSSHPAGRVGVV